MPARTGLRSARRAPRLTESLSTSAFGTMPIDLSPRPPTADLRAASPRICAASPPTQRPSSPNFATLQSEPPTLLDIAAPNLATRSRACLTSVSLRHGFVPVSRRRQAAIDRDAPGFRRGAGRGRLAGVDGPPFADSRGSSTRSEDQAGRSRLAPPQPRHAGENDRCKACVCRRLTASTEDGLYAKITERH